MVPNVEFTPELAQINMAIDEATRAHDWLKRQPRDMIEDELKRSLMGGLIEKHKKLCEEKKRICFSLNTGFY
ncbi:hypothetical protein CGLAMM_02575 [Acetobacteraceae bacterium EV16G]|uniref:Uncharacterized protein n=1 Tax=Sorlinia euscelidii TaxID=3081148 RepID=A0ABU7U4M4_9PROT